MPWFKIDDGFHCHPKVFAAGTPAVGLYVRCGSWAAQQTTDGIIPKQIAKLYGTPRMIKALVDANLWHQNGHDCKSCPQLDANSYAIHQYLDRNPSRVETELTRQAKSQRQQKWREGKRNDQVNEDGTPNVDGDVDASTRRHGDAAPNPTRPVPSPVPPSEEQASPPARPISRIGDRPRIPTNCQPLVDQITAGGVIVGWDLEPGDWFVIEALILRCTIPVLAQHALGTAGTATTRIRKGSYFIPGWRGLPDVSNLPAVPGAPALAPVPTPQAARRNASRSVLDRLTEELRAAGGDQ